MKKYSKESGRVFVLVNGFAQYFLVDDIIDLPFTDLNESIFTLNILTLEMSFPWH